ncbi:MAG TPA: hypothetical protein VNN99_03065 [Vicinamibacterales bacterium]|nr:hypothetical protein [Vicinamibacterales bacterium]
MSTMHPFEEAGFGRAPYALDGVTRNWFTAGPGDPGKPGGSCDYCGTGIAYEYWVRSADGRRFKVGCDCIAKLARKDNTASGFGGDQLARDADIARRRLERDRRAKLAGQKQQAAIAAFRAWYTLPRRAEACAMVHPNIAGLTLAHKIEWLLSRGYVPGRCERLESADTVRHAADLPVTR